MARTHELLEARTHTRTRPDATQTHYTQQAALEEKTKKAHHKCGRGGRREANSRFLPVAVLTGRAAVDIGLVRSLMHSFTRGLTTLS